MTLTSDIVKSLLTRLVFASHVIVSVWWVVQVTGLKQLWYLVCFNGVLFVETLVSILYRKGKEYKWFSPSIFCHLAAIIPCAWILELHMLNVRTNDKADSDLRYTNTTTSNKWEHLISAERWTDLIEQTTLLLMILGRWLLPNDYLTRDSLSQLLLINLGMAADIIEFFDILKLDFVRKSRSLALTILSLWTWSLLQFPFNLTATFQSEEAEKVKINQTLPANNSAPYGEQHFKPRASMTSYDFKQMIAAKRASVNMARDLSHHAPRRYSLQPFMEEGDISLRNVSLPQSLKIPSESAVNLASGVSRGRPRGAGRHSLDVTHLRKQSLNGRKITSKTSPDLLASQLPGTIPSRGVHVIKEENPKNSHVTAIDLAETNEECRKSRITGDLVSTLMSLFMEDGPFLTVRLLMIAHYQAFEYMIIFLTVKNALVLSLQVYRLCILHCVCHDHKENDFSPGNEVDQHSRLANVQIAVAHDESDYGAMAAGKYGRLKGGWYQATRSIRTPLFYSRAFSREQLPRDRVFRPR